MQTASEIEMIVLTGEQAGARRLLDNNTTFTISGNMDTDVVFRDPNIVNERVNLITKDSEVFIQVLSGNIEVQGKLVTSGDLVKVQEYAKVKIGETTFSCANNLNASWRDIVDYVSKYEVNNNSNNKLSALRNPYSLILLFLLITALSVLVAYVYFNKQNANIISTISSKEIVSSYLNEQNYKSLSINENEAGQLIIAGFLMTNKELSNVESYIDTIDIPILLDISTGDHLAAEVRELYRVHGVEADVKALKSDSAIVTTIDHDKEKLKELQNIALLEIPSLKELDTEYIESKKEIDTTVDTAYFDKEDKRITMVVDGVPAYVMTRDKSRYYVGAILPTGHKIVSILNKEVKLEKGGIYTTLEF